MFHSGAQFLTILFPPPLIGGFAILECREPITDRPTGQVVLDYLTDTVIAHKTALFGQPHVSPDSRHVVTLERGNNSVVIVAQQITENGKF